MCDNRELKVINKYNTLLCKDNGKLQAENKRLREALEEICRDRGYFLNDYEYEEIATEALTGEK